MVPNFGAQALRLKVAEDNLLIFLGDNLSTNES